MSGSRLGVHLVTYPRTRQSSSDVLQAAFADALARVSEQIAWQDGALCAQTDPEAFFPEKGGSTASAKAVCRCCPVRAECLEYALERSEAFGIWGGKSERERRAIRRSERREAA